MNWKNALQKTYKTTCKNNYNKKITLYWLALHLKQIHIYINNKSTVIKMLSQLILCFQITKKKFFSCKWSETRGEGK